MNDHPGRISIDALVVALGYLTSFGYPLVALPFLARVLGAEVLGTLIIIQGVLQIVIYICDYGFSVSALRRVAVRKNDDELGVIISSTVVAKAILFGASALTLICLVLVIPGLRPLAWLFVLGLVLVAAGTTFPSWLLQGLGRLTSFSLIMACSRLVALAGLLLTVSTAADIGWALAWQFLPLGLAALLGWLTLAHAGYVRWQKPSRAAVRFAFVDGKHLFVGHLAIMSMGAANSVVLGAVAGPVQAAYYGVAERLANAGRGIMGGVQDAMLPRMSQAVDDPAAIRVRWTIGGGIFGAYAVGGTTLVCAAPWLVPWYLGPGYEESVPLAQLAGLTLCVAGLSAVCNLWAAAAHRFKAIARVTSAAALTHLLLLVPACALAGAYGAAGTVLLSEVLLCLLFFIDHRRHAGPDTGHRAGKHVPPRQLPGPVALTRKTSQPNPLPDQDSDDTSFSASF